MRTPGLCIVLLMCVSAVRADEEKVPLDKVPKAVLDAVKAKFPDAKLLGATTEKDGDKLVYEISLEYKKHHHDVTLQPDGKILDIEKEIPFKDVPKAVSDALFKKYPKADVKIAEELAKGDGKVIGYEILLVSAEGQMIEVVLATDGKITKEEKKKKAD